MSQSPDKKETVRALLDAVAEGLAQVLESMTESRPQASWEAAAGTLAETGPGADAEMIWWRQKLQILPQPAIWVGAPRAAWEDLGARPLKAAGVEPVETSDARSTWLEILSQVLGGVARSATAWLGEEVTCADGAEEAPPAATAGWFRIVVTYDAALPPIWVLPGAELIEKLEKAAATADESKAAPATPVGPAAETPAGPGRTMELLLDVELPVSLSFGRSQLPLKDVLKLTTGSIVELNRGVSEPVDVLVNQCLIARGEVVVVDGNYAVRIQQIVSPQERLRSVR